ncbi:MAG TPA: hypothetical protein VFR85_11280 [Anaeromyxobacteraceae bacterium]|nr:hypothetical protein [Anaeromyxobacteraceae bacterium]
MRRATALFAAALAGCETIQSQDIATHGLYADLESDGYGTGVTHVSAELRAGGDLSNVSVDLGPCDQLSATLGGEGHVMARRDDILGRVWYEAIFGGEPAGAVLRIAFLRSDAGGCSAPGPNAPDSAVTLPAPFSVTAPAAGTPLRRSASFTVSWTPASQDPMALLVSGPCIRLASFAASPGASGLVVPTGAIQPVYDPLASCTMDLELTRVREGTVDPAFGEGGRFVARQTRRVTAQTVP